MQQPHGAARPQGMVVGGPTYVVHAGGHGHGHKHHKKHKHKKYKHKKFKLKKFF